MNIRSRRYRAIIKAALVVCPLVPAIVFGGYVATMIPLSYSWKIIVTCLLWGIAGALTAILLLRKWEGVMRGGVEGLVKEKVARAFADSEETVPALPFFAAERSATVENGGDVIVYDKRKHNDAGNDEEIENLKHSLSEKKNIIARLKEEIVVRERDVTARITKESEEIRHRLEGREEELCSCKSDHDEQIIKRDAMLSEYQRTIAEQRLVLEKKQKYLMKLENKVRDLTYEIKTLLNIGSAKPLQQAIATDATQHPVFDVFDGKEHQQSNVPEVKGTFPVSSDSEIHTSYDASVLLMRCITFAENLTGAQHLAGQGGRALGLSSESYAIDLRRLCDTFRNEHAGVVILYSAEDNKVLFINNQIRGLLGWSPEKAAKEFFNIMRKGRRGWQEVIVSLKGEAPEQEEKKGHHIRLLMKAKTGEDILVRCSLGKISKGIFSDYIVSILYPV
jgi:hypothetical protein